MERIQAWRVSHAPSLTTRSLKLSPKKNKSWSVLNDILTFAWEKRHRLQTQGTNTKQKFSGCIAGGIPNVSDKKGLSQNTLSAWQEPPNEPHRLRYFQAKHQPAD